MGTAQLCERVVNPEAQDGAFQARGAIMATTDDRGAPVNNAPVLKMANIGVSMGKNRRTSQREPWTSSSRVHFDIPQHPQHNVQSFQLSTATAAFFYFTLIASATPSVQIVLVYINPYLNSSGLREQVKPVNVIRNYIYKCTDPVPEKVRDNEQPQPDTKGIHGTEQARRSTLRRPSRLFSKKTTDRLFEVGKRPIQYSLDIVATSDGLCGTKGEYYRHVESPVNHEIDPEGEWRSIHVRREVIAIGNQLHQQ
ncbi:hypothetical protein EDB92DRAFT_1817539 [Lactarius akahatsu]|uniref:Uncharacterized protein n=1 Tax=Lactarius akahatsu TaxID=416441 RepID=A0AAD4LC30_9AGAM|nr:hypothetical protein EDB92DRAFT_1817539 [Lactarius akahatsu]